MTLTFNEHTVREGSRFVPMHKSEEIETRRVIEKSIKVLQKIKSDRYHHSFDWFVFLLEKTREAGLPEGPFV